jgi:hypothetical protein
MDDLGRSDAGAMGGGGVEVEVGVGGAAEAQASPSTGRSNRGRTLGRQHLRAQEVVNVANGVRAD